MPNFDDLPPELRNKVYEHLIPTPTVFEDPEENFWAEPTPETHEDRQGDSVRLSSKPLSDGSLFTSHYLRAFISKQSRKEYRDMINQIMTVQPPTVIEANILDFKFTTLTKYLREQEVAGLLHHHLEGGNSPIRASMRFSHKFDGEKARAQSWIDFTDNINKMQGRKLVVVYDIVRVERTPQFRRMQNFLSYELAHDPKYQTEWKNLLYCFEEKMDEAGKNVPGERWRIDEQEYDDWMKQLQGGAFSDLGTFEQNTLMIEPIGMITSTGASQKVSRRPKLCKHRWRGSGTRHMRRL